MKYKIRAFSSWDGLWVISMVILLGLLLSFPFWNRNNRALFYMMKKKHEKAEQTWRMALGKEPFSPLYRMNLAFNYMLWEQSEKALQEYAVTRKLIDKTSSPFSNSKNDNINQKFAMFDLKEKTFFNSAIGATQNREIDKALNFYQQALLLNPESLRTKTNIELLIQENPVKNQNQKKDKEKSGKDKEDKNNKSESAKQQPEEQSQNSQETEKSEKEKEGEQGAQKADSQKEKESEESVKEEQSSGQPGEKQSQNPQETEQADSEKEKQKGYDSSLENKAQDNQNAQGEQGDFKAGRNNQKLNQRQTEAILKAILEQEKNIRERRSQERKRRPVVEKDW